MNLILRILVIAVLATLGQLFLPWWTIAIVALLVEALVGKADSTAFYSGFYGIAIPWIALAAYIDMKSGSILTVRILEMFKLPPYGFVMVIVTGLLGGLIGGLSSMLGGWIRQIFQDGKE
ncbi:MAG: hypothetical protein H6601_07470 [Flavobacteriales bacterium]|nr:hypothetical protein [Flavobacteriales bacterium]